MSGPLGLPAGSVTLVAYDASWPELYRDEARRIEAALAPLTITLEHTGSTSVPGLCAKPVVDILAGYDPGAGLAGYIERLLAAGYLHRGEQGIPGREFFRRGDPRAWHLHLAPAGGAFWREHLAFRDYLRAHDDVRDEYARLKYALAARFPADRESYIEGKGPFVRAVLARALAAPVAGADTAAAARPPSGSGR